MNLVNKIKAYQKRHQFFYDPDKFNEIKKLSFYEAKTKSQKIRFNLIIPNIDKTKMYGGIKTALNLYFYLVSQLGAEARIIIQQPMSEALKEQYPDWDFDLLENEHPSDHLITSLYGKNDDERKIDVRANDLFLTTYWTSHYCVSEILNYQKEQFGVQNKIYYLIQDFEPSFSNWSDEYMLCESTYHTANTFAIINSLELSHYLHRLGYAFSQEKVFLPRLTPEIKVALDKRITDTRKKQIIFYGRPETARNCFPLVIEGINLFMKEHPTLAKEWEFISIGSPLDKKVILADGRELKTLGKMSLEDYAQVLNETAIGISLMSSPHPSYPPLEMAAADIITITNQFVDKDLSHFSNYMISLEALTFEKLANAIDEAIKLFESGSLNANTIDQSFYDTSNQFDEIVKAVKEEVENEN